MGTYNIAVDEIIDEFRDFLQEQEGDVSAKVIAGAWNEIAKEEKWDDRLESSHKSDSEKTLRERNEEYMKKERSPKSRDKSGVFIEDAQPLTKEGIRKVCEGASKSESKSQCSKCGGDLHFHDKDDIVSEPMICGYCERGEENPDLNKSEEKSQ